MSNAPSFVAKSVFSADQPTIIDAPATGANWLASDLRLKSIAFFFSFQRNASQSIAATNVNNPKMKAIAQRDRSNSMMRAYHSTRAC